MLDDFYAPWTELGNKGVVFTEVSVDDGIKHHTKFFLPGLGDVLGILSENKIGFAL